MKKKTLIIKKAPENLRFAVLATDVVAFTIQEGSLKVLLIKINIPPYYKNTLALPGGIVDISETARQSALKQLEKKVKIKNVFLEQLFTFSGLKRDPRNRVVSVAYWALVPPDHPGSRVPETEGGRTWVDVNKISRIPLSYDHNRIVDVARERLQTKLLYTAAARGLLPKYFTFKELQNVYEIVLGRRFDKRNFRKKMTGLGVIGKTKGEQRGGKHRPAQLYTFIVDTDYVVQTA